MDKSELVGAVSELLLERGAIHSAHVFKEVDWFFNRMGIDPVYFETLEAPEIADHISSVYAGKLLYHAGNANHDFKLEQVNGNKAFFVCRSDPGASNPPCGPLEQRIDRDYLLEGYSGTSSVLDKENDVPYRLKVFRSTGSVLEGTNLKLRFYMLEKPQFPPVKHASDKFEDIADVNFLVRAHTYTRDVYADMIEECNRKGSMSPLVTVKQTDRKVKGEHRLFIAYKHGTVHSIFSVLTDIYHNRGLVSTRKFVEQFANGITIISVYLVANKGQSEEQPSIAEVERRIQGLMDDVSLFMVLPKTSLTPLFRDGTLTAHEVVYAYVVWKFAHVFLSRYNREYSALLRSVKSKDPDMLSVLLKLKKNLRTDTFTEVKVMEAMTQYPSFIKMLYADFEARFAGRKGKPSDRACSKFEEAAEREARSEIEASVLKSMIEFNCHVLKTNFYKPGKVALSFRLDPEFLNVEEYPQTPYGIFFIVGGEFRGFHVRFDDVARGGIRIIRSANQQAFSHNVGRVFDENYGLANTQQRKNKDIPEGGAKGTIFLSLAHQDKGEVAFQKYVDALLDVILPDQLNVDYYNKEEILFLGPDEGTADYMDWASQHARHRGASFWKAFTTGKSVSLGGIPHDKFGMTTRSVHSYVTSILQKLGLEESQIRKFQTGGPDGDLGSNEILISCDKTCSIVDGSGVLHDPNGIDRKELQRLAKRRLMVREFNMRKLSRKGWFVDVDERSKKLPDGTTISNGLFFRNGFHLDPRSEADIFVPCGGRPEAVHVGNVYKLLPEGKPRFKVIVEGANLFFTQEARLVLEEHGVILCKDASANKGGVTSSSLEVLASLALSDEEFDKCMQVKDEKNVPEFYSTYVEQVLEIIEKNAKLEFDCMWRERKQTPMSVLSDILSNKINALNLNLRHSVLWEDEKLRRKVIMNACPRVLLDKVGLDTFFKRVPEPYVQAIFGSHLASTFIYKYGMNAPEFAFFDFMQGYTKDLK